MGSRLGIRPHPLRARLALGVAVVVLGALALACVASGCLADLSAFPAAPNPSRDEPSALVACGDGFIESLDDGGDAGESCDPGDASAPGCEQCAITCTGRIDGAGHCYFLANDTSSYSAAVSACAAAGAHVITFASENDEAVVQEVLASRPTSAQRFWVGLSIRDDRGGYAPPLSVNEPGWPSASGASACAGCFALGADDAGSFAFASGDDGGGSAACLVSENGRWLRAPCVGSEARRTLCEREPAGQRTYPCGGLLCTSLPSTMGKKRYVLWPSLETAESAATLCATSPTQGSLWIAESREEREQLAREVLARFTSPVELWIGLSFANNAWRWEDGMLLDSGLRPSPWGSGQPSVNAGRAYVRIDDNTFDTQLARADDEDAGAKTRFFVCQHPAQP